MPITRRSAKGARLTVPEIDANLDPLDQLAPFILTISSGVITIPSSGTSPAPGVYRILPQSGTADDLTQINGALGHEELITLRLNTNGHIITLIHTPGNLRLSTASFVLDSIYDSISFKSPATNVWAEFQRSSVPAT